MEILYVAETQEGINWRMLGGGEDEDEDEEGEMRNAQVPPPATTLATDCWLTLSLLL